MPGRTSSGIAQFTLTGALSKGPENPSRKKSNRVVWQIPGHSQCLPFTVGDKGRPKSYPEN
ncbi:hypothetical protein ACFL36_06230 [Thermodesulfobacteriota bacterium]